MWKKLNQTDKDSLNGEIALQHHAIQYIALAGKYLIPEKEDDNHTSMEWKTSISSFTGNYLPHFTLVGVKIPELRLIVYDENYYIRHAIDIPGHTGKEIFEWLKKALQSHKIESQNLKYDLHYEIPGHSKYDDQPFPEPTKEVGEITGRLRTNANQILKQWKEREPSAADVRVWPHHFDTGTFVPYLDNHNTITQSIGLGLAIADDLVDEPYFYVNHWTSQDMGNYPELPQPGQGKWVINGWKGSVLPFSTITSHDEAREQEKTVKTFFRESVDITKDLLE
ncbi:MAG: hypothetical protein K9I74_06180 [Bacteroidales bacterium]|nr:hypothetical protein [Bacteroidales bacterium]